MISIPPNASGIGLRLPHIAEVVATHPPATWLEIHPENFLANPHAAELLSELARQYPISIHTVGISIGSAGGIDRRHLKRIRDLVDRTKPVFVSGHLAWSTHNDTYLNDLLPLPYNAEALRVVEMNVHKVQDELGRPYLIENPSSYLGFAASTMTEAEFLCKLVRRSGCRLLCDLSNIHVSAHNMNFNPREYIDALPAESIDEFHLGGYTPEDGLLLDTHAAPIADHAWNLYAYALRRLGPRPTLIEWDNDLPPLGVLLGEAARADKIAADFIDREADCARSR
ncbi:MAG TPA: DUF692 domain-containing protein [Terriglobia bacterium]|nr:DUF692 domain-containing protein [Terriglobia bacterium]